MLNFRRGHSHGDTNYANVIFFMKLKNFLTFICSMFDMKHGVKGIDINGPLKYMVGVFLLSVLAFTWFFPTLNGASAINNTTKLELGGTNYSWFIPAVIVCILIVLLLIYLKPVM